MEYVELFYKKVEVLSCNINKIIVNNKLETELLNTTITDRSKDNIKLFLAKTLPHKEFFRKQSTKLFSSDYFLYKNIHAIWNNLTEDDKIIIWRLLFEMFMISIQIFPIVKNTDYTYVSIYLLLDETKTDITIPKLNVLTLASVLAKEALSNVNKDFEEGKISKQMIELLVEEMKMDSIPDMNQINQLKEKFKGLMEHKEVKLVLEIVKSYFTDYVIQKIGNECKEVFESKKFKSFTEQFSKDKIISMIQKQELSFVNIRQMLFDSGITDLLGEDFEFPTCFNDFVNIIKKYTGKEIKETDLKQFFEENLKTVSETPYFKKFMKDSSYKHILDPIMKMFVKKDHHSETLKRKEKRCKKKLNKLNKLNKKEEESE